MEISDTHVLQDTEEQTGTLVTCYPFYYVGRKNSESVTKPQTEAQVVDSEVDFVNHLQGHNLFDSLCRLRRFQQGYNLRTCLDELGEFRYLQEIDFFDTIFDAEFFAFAEYGVVFNQGTGEPGREDIASAGGGVRLFLPDQYVLGLEMAFPLDQKLERTQNKDGRLFVNFSKRF